MRRRSFLKALLAMPAAAMLGKATEAVEVIDVGPEMECTKGEGEVVFSDFKRGFMIEVSDEHLPDGGYVVSKDIEREIASSIAKRQAMAEFTLLRSRVPR